MKKINIKNTILSYLRLTCSALVTATCLHMFVVPNNLVPGGFSGIASIIYYATGFPVQYSTFLLNLPLLVLSVIFLSKEFAVKTIYATVMGSVIMELFDILHLPVFDGEILVAVFIGGILAGMTLVLAYGASGSNGGTEIVAKLITKKKPDASIGTILMSINIVVMSIGGFFTKQSGYNLWIVVYSLLYSYVCSFVLDHFSQLADPLVKFTIITDKPAEVGSSITNALKRGANVIECQQPSGESCKNSVIEVVVQVRQVPLIKKILQINDAECFAFTTAVDGVILRPDFNKRYKVL
ncbi:MAG: YitT family protein [Clostridia bacterium]